jgi:hypothetical protein
VTYRAKWEPRRTRSVEALSFNLAVYSAQSVERKSPAAGPSRPATIICR